MAPLLSAAPLANSAIGLSGMAAVFIAAVGALVALALLAVGCGLFPSLYWRRRTRRRRALAWTVVGLAGLAGLATVAFGFTLGEPDVILAVVVTGALPLAAAVGGYAIIRAGDRLDEP